MNEIERSLGSGAAASATTAHTPGPWRADEHGEVFAETGSVASVWQRVEISDQEVDCNARLIAAAPELLQAARDARALLLFAHCPVDWLDAVIAKATWREAVADTEMPA